MAASVVKDPNTFANIHQIRLERIELDWTVDFERNCISGSCTNHYVVTEDCDKLILDTSQLQIERISLNGEPCEYELGEENLYGRALTVHGDFRKGAKGTFQCHYSTSPSASAIQFVGAELTADQTHPFLYSQCQPIHARSLLPCMDTPAIKQKYSAKVAVPKGMVCLMSAVCLGQKNVEAATQFRFEQLVPIPSYLLAIVVGALIKRDVSPRCALWTEPSLMPKAYWEFAETEKMLQIAEELMGEYRWGRYDMIVLPPFFPFGGMENPCMTFLTPTIIAGDRSLTPVIAHEIAHSWTGNLVTNASWEHFWLNEGFTEFAEMKILGRLFGEEFRLFRHQVFWEEALAQSVNEQFHPEHPFTKLCTQLEGLHPDDAFSTVPYVKGSSFLLYLEQMLGDKSRFEQFLRDYISKFALQSIMTEDWKKYFTEYFADKKDVLDSIDWDNWLHQPGMPKQKPNFSNSLLPACQELADKWLFGSDAQIEGLSREEFENMLIAQKEKFLGILDKKMNELKQEDHKFKGERVAAMESKYQLNGTGNCDILSIWVQLAIRARWEPIVPVALKLVTDFGRMKYVRPCYKLLFQWEASRQRAIDCFERNKGRNMHPISRQCVQALLKQQQAAGQKGDHS